MRAHKTAIIMGNQLLAQGLSHYIKLVAHDPQIEIFGQMPGTSVRLRNNYVAVFLDTSLLTSPADYTIGRIYNNNKGLKLVSVSAEEPPKNILAYFDAVILFRDREEEILEKLQDLYKSESGVRSGEKTEGILSDREMEVLRSVAHGNTNKEISDSLRISTHTVITHRKNITSKLGIKTIAGLTVYSILNGIISTEDLNPHEGIGFTDPIR